MAHEIITLVAREKLAKARAGIVPLSPIVKMAFGDGGHDTSGNIIEPGETLRHELLRKDIDNYREITKTSYCYVCTLEKSELAGNSISEIALVDADGDCVGLKSFFPKIKDDDMEMAFEIEDQF